jgi:DNA-binding GntR family transcriptional regulator
VFIVQEKKENSSNEVLRYVVEMVISGKILPAEVIYETSIAAETGLSRTPVREALTSLVNDGFLVQTRGKRGYSVPALTLEDMRNIYHARECLEQKIAFLAAENAVKADVEMLEQINAEETPKRGGARTIYTQEGSSFPAADVDVRFHLGVARIACNNYLERVYEMVFWRNHLYAYYLINRDQLGPEAGAIFQRRKKENRSAQEHAELIRAIAMRDGILASRLTLESLHATTYYAAAFLYPESLRFSQD